MRFYLDTSALVKLYVEEEGSHTIRAEVAAARTVATSLIVFIEARAAFALRRREGQLSSGDYRRTIREFDADWGRYLALDVTVILIRRAAALAETHALRAYDAIHLAAAKVLHERLAEPVSFASWDSNLLAAARREGLKLVPRK